MSMYIDEFEEDIKWCENSTEEFEIETENYGFVEPALLAVITGLVGEIALLFISLNI